jgi:hypothetical protein
MESHAACVCGRHGMWWGVGGWGWVTDGGGGGVVCAGWRVEEWRWRACVGVAVGWVGFGMGCDWRWVLGRHELVGVVVCGVGDGVGGWGVAGMVMMGGGVGGGGGIILGAMRRGCEWWC